MTYGMSCETFRFVFAVFGLPEARNETNGLTPAAAPSCDGEDAKSCAKEVISP